MLFKSLSLASAAGLAVASPMSRRDAYPPLSTSTFFTLVANVTDITKNIFDPPVNGWSLSGVHSGAGLNTAVLNANGGAIFFVNGTGQEVSSASTSVGLPPIASSDGNGNPFYTPQGLQFSDSTTSDEVYLGLNFGLGTKGAGITPGLRSPYADLFGPFGSTLVVCNETAPVYTRPQYPVRGETVVPDNCVAITLLAQCASGPTLEGVEELNIITEDVKCYEDVSAIDWSQY
jgi:hypothetical protein